MSLSLSRRVSLSGRGTSTARPGHPGCTIDGADDEGNTPLHHARRGPQSPKPTNIRDCWKEFHRNLGLAESVFDYRHQSLSISPSATAEILRGITEIMGHKAMEHGVTFELGGKAEGSPQPRQIFRGFHDVPQH